ncbi:uncharacterized protein LOC134454164 [Engraulis encrasicolus]|uniref:uncharacterized protein LOC134454164 n=1 Tax=Engraulis encrasicolus TaxID=184585 RepID=UPI002FD4AEE8
MADRKREVHVMDIISEAEEEPVKAPRPRPVKWETLYENPEDIRIENIVFHKAWVHATQHSQDVVSPEVHVGMPEGDTARAKAEIPLSIDLLESVYANLSCIDMDLLHHLEQLSKDFSKGDYSGGDQPSQASESPVLVPNAGDRVLVQWHLTMHEEDEKEKEKEGILLEEERRQLLPWVQQGGLAIINTAAAQMKYIWALLFSNIFVQMMQKLHSFINI